MLVVFNVNGKYIRALTNNSGEIVFQEEITESAYIKYISSRNK